MPLVFSSLYASERKKYWRTVTPLYYFVGDNTEVSMFFGIVLVILGALLLLNEMGVIHWSFWGYIWPVIIIAVGLKLIFGDKRLK
jgi:hypothetical protein